MQLLSEQLDELHNSGDCGNYLAGLADKARKLEGQAAAHAPLLEEIEGLQKALGVFANKSNWLETLEVNAEVITWEHESMGKPWKFAQKAISDSPGDIEARIDAINGRSRLRVENEELRAQLERLRGITPELPPRSPEGEGLPRYGIRWNGPTEPLAVPMDDGCWTPWHLAVQRRPAVPDGWCETIIRSIQNMEYAAYNLCDDPRPEQVTRDKFRVTESTCPERSLLIAIRDIKELLNAAPQPPDGCIHVGVIDHAMISGVSLTGDGAALPHGTKLYAALQPQ